MPKKNGKLRLIIDLSLLNRYIEKQAFKMETVKSVRQAMRLNDWAVSIDLTDAYLHVPIHHQSRKYLRFVHEDQVQLTLVISNFTGPDKNVRFISRSRQPNCDVIGMTTVRLSVRQTCLEGTYIWQFK